MKNCGFLFLILLFVGCSSDNKETEQPGLRILSQAFNRTFTGFFQSESVNVFGVELLEDGYSIKWDQAFNARKFIPAHHKPDQEGYYLLINQAHQDSIWFNTKSRIGYFKSKTEKKIRFEPYQIDMAGFMGRLRALPLPLKLSQELLLKKRDYLLRPYEVEALLPISIRELEPIGFWALGQLTNFEDYQVVLYYIQAQSDLESENNDEMVMVAYDRDGYEVDHLLCPISYTGFGQYKTTILSADRICQTGIEEMESFQMAHSEYQFNNGKFTSLKSFDQKFEDGRLGNRFVDSLYQPQEHYQPTEVPLLMPYWMDDYQLYSFVESFLKSRGERMLQEFFDTTNMNGVYEGRFIRTDQEDLPQYLFYSVPQEYSQGMTEGMDIVFYAVAEGELPNLNLIWSGRGYEVHVIPDVNKDGYFEIETKSVRVKRGRLDRKLVLWELKELQQEVLVVNGFDLSARHLMSEMMPGDTLTKSIEQYRYMKTSQGYALQVEYKTTFKNENGQERIIETDELIPIPLK